MAAKMSAGASKIKREANISCIMGNLEPCVQDVRKFIEKYSVSKDKRQDIKSNFVCTDNDFKRSISVPEEQIPAFMNMINKCYLNGTVLHVAELQASADDYTVGSGLMLDFDILLDHDRDIFDEMSFEKYIETAYEWYFNNLVMRIDGEDDSYPIIDYAIVISKPKPVYKEELHKYKHGYHLIMPSIKINKITKRCVYQYLVSNEELKGEMRNNVKLSITDILDPASTYVPNYLVGSCKGEVSEPYQYHMFYQVNYTNISTKVRAKTTTSLINTVENLPYEASLNYELAGGIIKKRLAIPQKSKFSDIQHFMSSDTSIDSELDNAKSEITTMSLYNPDIEIVKNLLGMLSERRIADRNTWRDIIYALASGGHDFKPLAIWVSKRTPMKYDSMALTELWDDAINYRGEKTFCLKSIYYWAQLDSPDLYKHFRMQSIDTMMMSDILKSTICGNLQHTEFSRYLFFMFKEKYVTENSLVGTTWYEFVTDKDQDILTGQLFKWRRVGATPDTLIRYIADELPKLCKRVLDELDIKISKLETEDELKMFESIRKKFKKSIGSLSTIGYKKAIIMEAESRFRLNSFLHKMDKVPHVMGVANGVLEFSGPDIKLLNQYHSYPVSLYSETRYVSYDPENKYVKQVYSLLKSMFPEDEMDAFNYIMIYLSTSLDGLPKDSLFFILTGIGCHAKDSLIKMMNGETKMVQDIEIGDKILGDDGTERNVLELYRGQDEMVRIIPSRSEPFVVNQNHILSLKDEHGLVHDVKVMDLDLTKTHYLYTHHSTESFKIESIGKGDYYGFELDGNHRYVSADGFVHHNSNGKSFLMEFLKETLGNLYVRKLPISFITEQVRAKSAAANSALMELKHARLAIMSESEKNERLNAAAMKEYTGKETLSARQLFKEQENFKPNTNFVVTTNNRLAIESTDYSIWRRIITYQFKMVFVSKLKGDNKFERLGDPVLTDRCLVDKRYQEAFLSILSFYRAKLYSEYGGNLSNVPRDTIDRETAEYRNKEDIINRFIDSKCYYSEGAAQQMDEVISLFRTYYKIQSNIPHKGTNDDLKSMFLNSQLMKHFRTSNGITRLHNYKIVEEGYYPSPHEILITEHLKAKLKPVEEDKPSPSDDTRDDDHVSEDGYDSDEI